MADSQMSDRQLLELISKKVSVMDEKFNSIVGRIDKWRMKFRNCKPMWRNLTGESHL